MKKFLSAILAIVLLLNIPVTVLANDTKNESITLQGIEMSVDEFKTNYISKEKKKLI